MGDFDKNLEVVEASLIIPLNVLNRYNVTINGKRTSVTLEPRTWEILNEICEKEKITVHDLCALLKKRQSKDSTLSSSIRVFLISYLYAKIKYKN